MSVATARNGDGGAVSTCIAVFTILEFFFALANLVFYKGTDEEVLNRAEQVKIWVRIVFGLNSALITLLAGALIWWTNQVLDCKGGESCAFAVAFIFVGWVYFAATFFFMYLQSVYFLLFVNECKKQNENSVHESLLK